MKTIILLVLILTAMFLDSCKEEGISDQIYTFKGNVVDSATGIPIEGVLVAFKNPSLADSLIFKSDSINYHYPNIYYMESKTDSNGNYDYDAFLGHRQPEFYVDIFAFKSGYKIWRYQEGRDNVQQIGQYVDVLNIKLSQIKK